jgi:TPR repeat protein
VEKDEAKATRLSGQAAEHGLVDAQYKLGYSYDEGKGVGKDEGGSAVRAGGRAGPC